MPTSHIPVLLAEALSQLNLHSGDNVVDGTVDGGGHAEAFLDATAPSGRLLGLDLDPDALPRARACLARFGDRAEVVQGDFANLDQFVRTHPAVEPVRGVFLDLGLSSDLLADPVRGFSLQADGPLDMRFDPSKGESAAQFLNSVDSETLRRVLKEYGEERFAADIADAIVSARRARPFATTAQLVALVVDVYRKRLRSRADVPWVGGRHPATRTFQAVRIAVNDELRKLERGIAAALSVLAPGARLAVITFHSLEDRIVKRAFRNAVRSGRFTLLTKKPLGPTDVERRENPRSRSAKLRAIEHVDTP